MFSVPVDLVVLTRLMTVVLFAIQRSNLERNIGECPDVLFESKELNLFWAIF